MRNDVKDRWKGLSDLPRLVPIVFLSLAIAVPLIAQAMNATKLSPAMKASVTSAVSAGALAWGNDLSKSLLQAKTSHKYVLADVYTDWCGWCKRLDADTFGDQQMVDYLNQKFLVVKVNAEDEGGGKQVAEKYKVTGFPCALVFEPSGKFLGKISGYLRADQYQQALENLIKHPPADPYAD